MLKHKICNIKVGKFQVAFTSSHVHIAVRNTLDKLVDYSARDIMNIFSLSNIVIQSYVYWTCIIVTVEE